MGLDLMALWGQMGMFAKGIVILLALMSIYSLTVMVGKLIQIARSQSETRSAASAAFPPADATPAPASRKIARKRSA